VRTAAEEHVAAFNAWDTARVVAGFAPDATWVTGQDRFVGAVALTELFDATLWELRPHLAVRTLLVDGTGAALELVETLVRNGEQLVFAIAVFLDFDENGLIRRGTVYREGSADL
jgi:uncharacterized protein